MRIERVRPQRAVHAELDALSGGDAGHVYIAYEYVGGRTLREAMRAGELRDGQAVEAAAQILDGLAHAHAQGIVHRDVKPSNVLLAGDEGISVRLLDFGLAQFDEAETLTAVGDVPGTLAYISPERLRGREACAASDVWAVGIAGLTPIPYKLVTITSGFAGYNIWLFILCSIIARGGRFFAWLLDGASAEERAIRDAHFAGQSLGGWLAMEMARLGLARSALTATTTGSSASVTVTVAVAPAVTGTVARLFMYLYTPESLVGPHFAIARGIYYRQVGTGGQGFLNVPVYLGGARLESQIAEEVERILRLVQRVYSDFGMSIEMKLSTRPPEFLGAVDTDQAVRRIGDLSRPCLEGSADNPLDLRWVLLHLINETARHAGHADAVRELLDGTVGE